MTEEQEYVLGTHDAELARLGYQHQVWSEATVASWEHADFRRGDTLLDVGCGPGHVTFALANLVGPTGRVIAVDMSQRFIAHVQREAECRRVANIDAFVEELGALDLAPSSIDGAFARWVMCFLPDPQAVMARIARAMRPGAAFAILDYAHYEGFRMSPPSSAIERILTAVAESFRLHGGNSNIGLELPSIMRGAGLEVRDIRPIVRIGRPGTALWDWPRTFFEIFVPTLVERGLLTSDEQSAFWADWTAREENTDAYFMSPPMVEIIGVKSSE